GLVTVTGTGFAGCPSSVVFQAIGAFDSPPAAPTNCLSTQFSVVIPATATAHNANVIATFPSGSTVPTDDSAFTYVGSPVVTSISPQFGPATGGTTVTIRGTGFVGIICPTWSGAGAPPPGPTAVRFGA